MSKPTQALLAFVVSGLLLIGFLLWSISDENGNITLFEITEIEKQSGAVHPTVHFSDEQIKAMVEYVQQMTEELEK